MTLLKGFKLFQQYQQRRQSCVIFWLRWNNSKCVEFETGKGKRSQCITNFGTSKMNHDETLLK